MKLIKTVNTFFLLFIFCTANVYAGQIITKVKKIGMSPTGRILVGTGTAYKSSCSSSTLALPHYSSWVNFDQMYSLLLLAHGTDKGVLFKLSSTCVDGLYPQINYLQIQP